MNCQRINSCTLKVLLLLTIAVGITHSAQSFYKVTKDTSWRSGDSLLNNDYSSLTTVSDATDDSLSAVTMTQSFPFFDELFTVLTISSNGIVSLSNFDYVASVAEGEVIENSVAKSSFKQEATESASVAASSATVVETLKSHKLPTKEVQRSNKRVWPKGTVAPEDVPDDLKKHVTDSFLVSLHPHENRQDRLMSLAEELRRRIEDSNEAEFDAKVEQVLEHVGIVHLRSPSDSVKTFLLEHPHVMQIDSDEVVRALRYDNEVLNDPFSNSGGRNVEEENNLRRRLAIDFDNLVWGLDRIDQANLPLDNSPYTPPSATNGGRGVDVYVLDTGLDANHDEFKSGGSGRVVANVFSAFDSTTSSNNDLDGHGTHCSGTVGGLNVGVAPKANIYGVKVLNDAGSGSDSSILAGMNFVIGKRNDNATRPIVVSMSLGKSCKLSCSSDQLVQKADEMVDKRIAVVIAAGNDDELACTYSPSASLKSITVGATTDSDARSSFSNIKSCVDIFAPGSSILSACSSRKSQCTGSESKYIYLSGTSMATPHVAGVVALWLTQTAASYTTQAADPSKIKTALQCKGALDKLSDLTETSNRNVLLQVPVASASFEAATCNTATGCTGSGTGLCSGNGNCFFGKCLCNDYWMGETCSEMFPGLSTTAMLLGGSDAGKSFGNTGSPPYLVIAPLWTDLNPTAGGNIRHGLVKNGNAYAVVYDNIPAFSNVGSTSCRATVELLLYFSGLFEIALVKNDIGSSCSGFSVSMGFKGKRFPEATPTASVSFEQIEGASRSGISSAVHYVVNRVGPTNSPTAAPTTATPTAQPTIQPEIEFSVDVTLSGLTSSTFDSASKTALENSLKVTMEPDDTVVTFRSSTDVSDSSLVNTATVSATATLDVNVLLANGGTTTPQTVYDRVTKRITDAVSANTFTNTLRSQSSSGTTTENASASSATASSYNVIMTPTGPPSSGDDSDGSDDANVIYIAVAVAIVVIAILIALIACCVCRKKPGSNHTESRSAVPQVTVVHL